MSKLTRRTLQILLSLVDGSLHGYGIKNDVEARTEGTVRLGSGTLYEGIARLLEEGYISEVDAPAHEPTSGGPPRRFYAITATGRRALAAEIRDMDAVVRFAKSKRLLGGKSSG